jgi:hypothetical protein
MNSQIIITPHDQASDEHIFLKDITGDNPQIPFEMVIVGFSSMYRKVQELWGLPPRSEDSTQWKAIQDVKDFVLLNTYTVDITKNPNFDSDPQRLCEDSGIEPLSTSVQQLEIFSQFVFEYIVESGGTLTLEERYFRLFARAAYVKARIEMRLLGEFLPYYIDDIDDCYFSDEDIEILASFKHRRLENMLSGLRAGCYPSNLWKYYKDEFENAPETICTFPDKTSMPEINYYPRKKAFARRTSAWTHDQAVVLLSELGCRPTNYICQ